MKKFLTTVSALILLVVFMFSVLFVSVSEYKTVSTYNEVTSDTFVSLPVIMYHHIIPDEKYWGDYVIPPEQLERDLICIQNKGYTTVTCTQILEYFEFGTPLPDKPILLTFDDGYESVYEYAFPLLQEYNMNAVISIIGKYTDLYSTNVVKDLSYSHASWTELSSMLDSGVFEIGNHTYDLHHINEGSRDGVRIMEGESYSEYLGVLQEHILWFNENIEEELGVSPVVFAYPFGVFSSDTDSILAEFGFKIILTCEEAVNKLSNTDYSEGDLIKLKRFNRAYSTSLEEILSKT